MNFSCCNLLTFGLTLLRTPSTHFEKVSREALSLGVAMTERSSCVKTREQRTAAVSLLAELAAQRWEKILIDDDMEPGEVEFHRATIRKALDGAERRSRAQEPCLELAPAIAS